MPYKDKEKARACNARYYANHSAEQREAHRKRANAAMLRWYHGSPVNKAKVAAYKKKWKEANREWLNFTNGLYRYGLTLDQYHAKAESQDFSCALCGASDVDLVIDHHHGTGKVRGLLCWSCNSGVGQFKESPALFAKAAEYVAKWAA